MGNGYGGNHVDFAEFREHILKPSEVITADAQKDGLDPKKVLLATSIAVKKGGQILHHGNTTLVLEKIDDKHFATHLFTQDAPIPLSRSLIMFFRKLEKSGIHIIYGDASGTMLNLLRRIAQKVGAPIKDSDRRGYTWMIKL